MTTKPKTQRELHPIWGSLKELTSLVTAIGVIALGIINITSSNHAKKVGAQAVAAAENQAIAADKTRGDMHEVRKAVDGHLTEIMQDKAIALRRLATKDPTPENIADADKAETQFKLRLLSQKAQMDSNAKAKLEADGKQDVPIPK